MKILYYDCSAGISGDMNLGAMIDLGVPAEYLTEALKKIAPGSFDLQMARGARRGVQGTRVEVLIKETPCDYRRLHDIESLLAGADLSDTVRKRSLDIFMAIAQAEADIHGLDPCEVHFHEVGAIDSIVDIVGAVLCHEYLGAERIMSSPVELGGGWITCAHGKLPVPAPATLKIAEGVPVRTGLVPFETTTPTGAAILVCTVSEFTDRANFRLLKTGYGLGSRDTEIPNVLRVMLGEIDTVSTGDVERSAALVIECTIDDMNPEMYHHIMAKCFDAGAQDVFLTPVIMKKTRPAVVMSVLCGREHELRLREIILTHTSTFGVRTHTVEKHTLRRDFETVTTKYGTVTMKAAYYNGRKIKSKPEYEDCRRLADLHKVPLTEIYRAVHEKDGEGKE